MDPRSSYPHPHPLPPTRYAPPPPPPPHLPDFYCRSDHHLPPPPQRQQSYHLVPAPPPLHPQFPPNPNPQFRHHPHNYPPPEFHARPKFGSDWATPVAYARRDLDPDPYRSPIGEIRYEGDSSRFLGQQKAREGFEFLCSRAQFESSRDLRKFESNLGDYDIRRGDLGIDRGREVTRGVRDASVGEIGGNDDRDRVRIFAGKRERYGSREGTNREGNHEFNRIPRKQVQKKSAFLRIQKPNYRNNYNREDHETVLRYPGYYDEDAKPGSFRGNKDQSSYGDRGSREGIREGSPVQLDVSFKSNSLVAKAIVTPSSNSTGVSDVKVVPRNSTVRRVLVPAKDGSNSSRPNDGSRSLKSVCVGNDVSRSEMDSKQSKDDRVLDSDISLLPSSDGTKLLPGKGRVQVVSVKGGAGKTSLLKVAKKKKIVKRVVKKVVNSHLRCSGSQPTKIDEHVKADHFSHHLLTSSETDKATAVASDSVGIYDLQPFTDKTTVMSDNEKVDSLAEGTITEKVGSATDSERLGAPNIKRKRSLLTSPVASSSYKEPQPVDGLANEDSIENLDVVANIEKDVTTPLNETSSSDIGKIEDMSKHLSQDGDSCSLDYNPIRGSPQILLGNTDFISSSWEKKKIREDTVNACNTPMVDDSSLINLPEGVSGFHTGIVDFGLNHPCTNKGSTSPVTENNVVDKILNVNFPIERNGNFHLSSSGETRSQNFTIHADSSDHKVEAMLASQNGCSNSDKLVFPAMKSSDVMGKQLSPDRVVVSLDGISMRGSVDNVLSKGGSAEDTPNILINDKKVEMPQLDLSRTEVASTYLEPANRIGRAQWVDTTLRLSFKDSSPAEFTIYSDVVTDIDLKPSADRVDVSEQSSSTNVSEATVSVSESAYLSSSGTSPRNKKRKISDSQLELSSPISSNLNEETAIAGIIAPGSEVASGFGNGQTQLEEEVAVSGTDALCTSDLPHLQKEIAPLIDHSLGGGCIITAASGRDDLEDKGLSSSHVEDLIVPKATFFCSSEMGGEQIRNVVLVKARDGHENDYVDMERGEGERVDVAEQQVINDRRTASCQIPSELQSPDLDERSPPTTDLENYNHLGVGTNLHSMSDYLSSLGYGKRVPISYTSDELPITKNTCDEVEDFEPDTLADMGAAETFPDVPMTTPDQISIEKVSGNDKIVVEKPGVQGFSNLSVCGSGSQNAKIVYSGQAMQGDNSFTRKKGLLPSWDPKNNSQTPNSTKGELYVRKNHPGKIVSRTHPGGSSFVFTASKHTASATHIAKPRTWHRTDRSVSAPHGNKALLTTVPAQRQVPKMVTKFQNTSYIRKGNSLVRNPTIAAAQSRISHGLSSAYHLNSSTKDEVKNTGSDDRLDATDLPNFVRAAGSNALFERPRTPAVPIVQKIPNTTNTFDVLISSPLAEPPCSHSTETTSDLKFTENNDVLKSNEVPPKIAETPIIQNSQTNNLDFQNEQNEGNAGSANAKSIKYVKRKSNQLVATSNSCALSLQNVHNTMAVSSDAYYKRKKHQLIRAPLESQVKQADCRPDESSNSEGKITLSMVSSGSFSRRQLSKVAGKICKPTKFSLVWTLCGGKLSKHDDNSLHHQKVFPHLFPWKRATYWRNFMANSSSTTMRNLLLLRKRDTVYKRSKHGFSLWKSKVLSVDGSSLKWSKSIERHSKKANEEATLAVAAADKKKRERSGAAHLVPEAKNRNNSSRERIFRIGSVRYKMDSSGRTLHRISDESSCSADAQTEKDAKKTYVPRRLVIGKDEYIRIGNGNQLIRNPKKRSRILASEKVRWSLHTARSRLSKKRKYCQFFTRFGKCNKGDGKCPYIHDSSKIAVCTKFLNGLCSDLDCKLTHKIIPERMPDCSYFLQGLCTNRNCPYRHVHVNPNASTCEGFLRGYCADGNECRKKHSYVCPVYEATGSCPQGSNCKLHHPRNRSKGKKGKQSREKKNAQGRYFGSSRIKVSESRPVASERHSALDDSPFSKSSRICDYINLDDSCDYAGEDYNSTNEQRTFSDSDPLDVQFDDLDDLMKPLGIMSM